MMIVDSGLLFLGHPVCADNYSKMLTFNRNKTVES